MGSKPLSRLGDTSSHGGQITFSPPTMAFCGGNPVAVLGALHTCPQSTGGVPHGVTPITPITTRTFCKGLLVITAGAMAGCGAVILPPTVPTGVMVE